MLLVKLSRGLKAIESKFLQFTDSGIDRKRVEQVDLSSVPFDKLFVTAVEEELTLYKKIIPIPSPSTRIEETTDDGEYEEGS